MIQRKPDWNKPRPAARKPDSRPVGRIPEKKPPLDARAAKPAPPKKQIWKAATLLSPVPVVMVTSADESGRANIATVAWCGTLCSDPPMLSISLRPATLSHGIIKRSMEFAVNAPSVAQARATDYCGVVSGHDADKFQKTGLTAAPASQIAAPIILECPLNLECKVRQTLELGSHTLFIAEIVAVQVTESLLDPKGRLALEKAELTAYAHGHYYALGRQLGHFGFSVRKKPGNH